MPKGHVMGVPGDPEALRGLLSEAGLARVAEDSTLPPTEVGDDVAIGEYVAARLGREVVDRLVEPLLGGVYAGDAYRISMRAAVPQLYEAARGGSSLLSRGARAPGACAGARRPARPSSWASGAAIGRLPGAVADACRAAGARIRTGASVRAVRSSALPEGEQGGAAGRWQAVTEAGEVLAADALVLALPAPGAARLLADEVPAAADELAEVEYASMALVTMAFRRSDLERVPRGSGFLVPPVDGRTIKASTFSSNKWGWVGSAGPRSCSCCGRRSGGTAEEARAGASRLRARRAVAARSA